MSDNLLAALAYAGRFNWPVFPCKPRDKTPLTPNGLKDATTDPEQIRTWWSHWPEANIGIPTGTVTGFDALDVDKGGDETLEDLEAEYGKIPETVEQITPSGGRHILFKHREEVRNSAKRLPGLDIRGEGGYIVVAPSIHPNGRPYAWEASSRPDEVEIAEWSDWLLDVLQAPPSNGQPRGPALAVGDQIPEGRRNQALTSLAGTMRRRGMSEDEIAAAILVANKQRCDPPLPDEEVQRIAASVGRYAPESTLLPVTLTLTKSPSNSIENTPVPGLPTDHVDVVAPIGGQQQQQGRFCRQTLGDLRTNYKPTRWLIEHLLPIIGILLMAGIPGIGKTWLVLLLALLVATGRSLLDRFQTRQGAVLLVLEEEDSSAVLERLDALYAGLELSQEEGDALPIHVLIQQGVSLITAEGTLEPELLRHIKEVKPVLVVLDPFRRVHGLDENSSSQMSALFNLLRQLQADMECSFLLIHHLRKRSEHTEDALDRLRGSSDIAASVDSVLEVGGQFGNLVMRHSKSKRGRALGSFLIKSEMMSGAIRFSYQDADIAAEIDREEIRKFILQILGEGPLNQSQLWEAGKERGFGRDRIKKVCIELEKEGLVAQQAGPRNSKLFVPTDLVVDAPAPPSTTRSEEEGAMEREEWVL